MYDFLQYNDFLNLSVNYALMAEQILPWYLDTWQFVAAIKQHTVALRMKVRDDEI